MPSSDGALPLKTRIVIGGLGGVAPVLLNLIVIDLQTLMLDLTALTLISYAIRVAALFTIGSLVAVFHKSETDLFKLFQLGIVAPALITATLNGSNVNVPQASQAPSGSSGTTEIFQLLPSAFAQAKDPELKQFTMPKESTMQQIYRGLFGSSPSNVWFVIAGKQKDLALAKTQAAELKGKGFAAQVYAPYGGSGLYSIVIGAHLTQQDAEALRKRALAAGLSGETHLWTFQRR